MISLYSSLPTRPRITLRPLQSSGALRTFDVPEIGPRRTVPVHELACAGDEMKVANGASRRKMRRVGDCALEVQALTDWTDWAFGSCRPGGTRRPGVSCRPRWTSCPLDSLASLRSSGASVPPGAARASRTLLARRPHRPCQPCGTHNPLESSGSCVTSRAGGTSRPSRSSGSSGPVTSTRANDVPEVGPRPWTASCS